MLKTYSQVESDNKYIHAEFCISYLCLFKLTVDTLHQIEHDMVSSIQKWWLQFER